MEDESAFPQIRTELEDEDGHPHTNVYSTGGMTLRDYFAGQVLAGWSVEYHTFAHARPEDVATIAYQVADAMLKARG